jgi:hypothetical protein
MGYPSITQTAHQINLLQQAGAEVINIAPYEDNGIYAHIAWHNNKIYWNQIDISPQHIQAVLVVALAPEFPQQEVFEQSPTQTLDWATWYRASCAQRDRSDTLLGLLLMYENAGIPVYNPSSASIISRRKPYQLSVLRNTGCPLPETLISNDYLKAQEFIAMHQDVILKPASGGALTLTPEQISEQVLQKVRQVPAIFQQRIRGADIRVIVINGKVVSAAKINVADNTLDFRGDEEYQQGKISYTEIELPDEITHLCHQLTQNLGLKIGGIDLKQTKKGEFYFLECNSSPIYLDVEIKLGHGITQAICNALLQH